jgi:predicted DNA-binding protein (MmcQ/YjbR family)
LVSTSKVTNNGAQHPTLHLFTYHKGTAMNTINVNVKGQQISMVVVSQKEASANTAAHMVSNNWMPVLFQAKRPNGKKCHLVFQAAKTGEYISISEMAF